MRTTVSFFVADTFRWPSSILLTANDSSTIPPPLAPTFFETEHAQLIRLLFAQASTPRRRTQTLFYPRFTSLNHNEKVRTTMNVSHCIANRTLRIIELDTSPMPKTNRSEVFIISALRARANFGKLLSRVENDRHSLIIEKRGTPRAVLLGLQDYVR